MPDQGVHRRDGRVQIESLPCGSAMSLTANGSSLLSLHSATHNGESPRFQPL